MKLGPQSNATNIPRVIEGDGFTLEALQDADPREFMGLVQDRDIQRYIPWAPTITSVESAERRLSIGLDRDHLRYGIQVEAGLAGYIAATREADGATFSTATAISRRHRKRGLSNRAFQLLCPVIVGLGGEKLSAYVALDNDASIINVVNRGMRPTDQLKPNAHGVVERRWEMELAS